MAPPRESKVVELRGARIKVPPLPTEQNKFTIKFTITEGLLAKLIHFHIRVAELCKAELRREVRRRERAIALRQKRIKANQIVNRFSGEVLSKS